MPHDSGDNNSGGVSAAEDDADAVRAISSSILSECMLARLLPLLTLSSSSHESLRFRRHTSTDFLSTTTLNSTGCESEMAEDF